MSKGKIIGKSIKEMIDEIRKTRGAYEAKRLERAADEVPNLEKLYKRDALEYLFRGENARGIMTMRPEDFEKYAIPIGIKSSVGPKAAELARSGDISKHTVPTDEYIKHLQGIRGFDYVPFLNVQKEEAGLPLLPYITGHEGRHRMRALAGKGQPSALVEFLPRSELRNSFPRSSREEYIEAIKQELGITDNMVRPEAEDRINVRPAIKLPDVYKGGGSVHKAGGGKIIKSVADMSDELMKKSAKGAGVNAPAVKGLDLTSAQDFHTSLGDRVNDEVMKLKKMMEGFDYKYDEGQRVFTKDSAAKNKPPYTIISRTRVGNYPMREDSPVGAGMGKPIKDPLTGRTVRTPFEPGYRVRLERGPDDWSEFDIPQSAIIGDVEMKNGGAVKMGKGGIAKSIADMIKEIRQTRGGYEAQRLERAADEVPNLERLYQEEALRGLFRGDNASGIMTMKPGDFESYAKRLSAADPITREMIDKKVGQLAKIRGGFSDVPFLEVDRANPKHLANISGHEGRHRMRALEKKGQPTSVVRFLPRASLREEFPRYTREEYLEALRKELGESPLVTPEGSLKANVGETEGVIELPDVYKAGGAVKMQDGGDPVREAIEQAKLQGGRRDAIPLNRGVNLEQMRREVEENARRVAQVKQELAPRPEVKPVYEPALKFLPKGTPESIRYAFEKAAKDAGPSMQVAQADGKPVGVTSEPGGFGEALSSAGALLDIPSIAAGEEAFTRTGSPALAAAAYTLTDPIGAVMGAPAAGRAAIKGAKALAPKLGETAEQYMFRTGMALPLDVWHGSPHRLPPSPKNPLGEFDPTKIGTGEGNQAFGHGHYLAEARGTGEIYRKKLSSQMPVNHTIAALSDDVGDASKKKLWVIDEGDVRIASADDTLNLDPNRQVAAFAENEADALRLAKLYDNGKLQPDNITLDIGWSGSLYKVDLPDEQIAKMLDWDKPLSEQSKEVRDALAKWVDSLDVNDPEKLRLVDKFDNPKNQNIKFGQLYNEATSSLWGKDTGELSRQLQQSGIPGIKYLDQASRDAGEGTRNFVVFPGNEDILTIKERMKDGGVAHKAGGGVARRLAKYAKDFEPSKKTEIFIGEKAKIWDAPAAAKAVQLEKAGVAPVDIWKQTGTFRSPDGDLRQEISDVGSKFRGEKEMKELASSMKQQEADIKQKIKDSKEHPDLFPKQLKTAQGELRQQAKDIKARRTMESGPEYRVGLGNRAEFALEHPELYKAYPPLSGMDVQQGGRSGSALGSYIRGIDESDPGMVNIYDRGLANDPRSTMIHEAQHAIQDIEGWGRGGNPEMAFQNPEAHKILENLRNEALKPMTYEEFFDKFKGSGIESMSPSDAIKHYELYKQRIPEKVKQIDRELQSQAAQLYYERLAGEAESRAAQARRDLTPEQRLEKFPLEVGDYGYDVKPEDIIVKRQKKGGQVSLDAMRLAVGGMAGGGIRRLMSEGIEGAIKAGKTAEKVKQYATPAKFERAPVKTKAEVEALAQRMAPQFLGEFVRKPESTFSVAGKSMKQYRREKDLPIVYGGERPTPDVFDITKHEGEMMVGVPGDPTIAHRTLEQIGDIRPDAPVELHGGPLYGLEGEFWASGKGPATGLQAVARRGSEAYGGVPVVGQYIRMPEGTPYALHTTDALLSFQRPEMLGKRKLEQLNAEIRRGNLKNKFPEFVGFEDPDLVLLQAQDNPNLRKHINNVLLKPTTAEKYGLYPGPDIDAAITEAGLRNLETGATGFSVGRLFPESKLIESAHPTYEFDIPGRMIGQTKYPQPYELTFPDALKFAREGLKPGVGEFGMLKMIGPRQIIDAQLVDEINMYQEAMKKLTGKKKGGTVKKAVGGGVMSAGQKLAKAFVEAGKKAKLPEQAKEAASKGELFLPDEEVKRMQRELLQGVKKPEELAEGGQITSDDLILEERPL